MGHPCRRRSARQCVARQSGALDRATRAVHPLITCQKSIQVAVFHLNGVVLQTDGPDAGLGGWVLRRGHRGNVAKQPATFGASRSHSVFRRCAVLLTFPICHRPIRGLGRVTGSDIVRAKGYAGRSIEIIMLCRRGRWGYRIEQVGEGGHKLRGSKRLAQHTLFGTPMEAHSSPWAPVM